MTLCRRVAAGSTYAISRHSSQSRYLLRPDAPITQLFLFCLGEAVARFDITLHGFVALSNQAHLVVRDNRGNLPLFTAHLHGVLARAVNAHWGERENVWRSGRGSVVPLATDQERFETLVALLASPVAADFVEQSSEWPGASSMEQNLSGVTSIVHRPNGYFRANGAMPERVKLRVERPDGFRKLADNDWATMLEVAVATAEDEARRKRAAAQRDVLGIHAVLTAAPMDGPIMPHARRETKRTRDERLVIRSAR